MVLGIIILVAGIRVIALFPWQLVSYGGQTETESTIPPEFQRAVAWAVYTFIVLIANLFLSGIGLILAGYGLYHTQSVKKTSRNYPTKKQNHERLRPQRLCTNNVRRHETLLQFCKTTYSFEWGNSSRKAKTRLTTWEK